MQSLAVYFKVTESEKDAILAEYGKTKDTIKQDVEILKEWLKKQQHIPQTDELFIEILLLRNKCRIEKTKIKIDNYYTAKIADSDYFTALDPYSDAIVKANKYHHACPMPNLTQKRERIIFWTMKNSSYEHFDPPSFLKYMAMLFETQLQLDYADSVVIIFDMTGFTMSMWLKYDLASFGKLLRTYFGSLSAKVSAVHYTNSPLSTLELIFKFARPLLPEKLKNRIIVHANYESLHAHIAKEYLPVEVGGTSVSAIELGDEIVQAHYDKREMVLKRNANGTNEKLRIGKPYIQVDLYGVDGTFKKINVD